MLNCPWCETKTKSNSALSSHLRLVHPDYWKGSVNATIPPDFDIGTGEGKRSGGKRAAGAWVQGTENLGPGPVVAKNNTCPACGKKAKNWKALLSHVYRMHRGLKVVQSKGGRPKAIAAQPPDAQQIELLTRWCPRCRLNIRAVETALRFAASREE